MSIFIDLSVVHHCNKMNNSAMITLLIFLLKFSITIFCEIALKNKEVHVDKKITKKWPVSKSIMIEIG